MKINEQLTKEQQEVVLHRGGNLIVSAAAGSGKTRVLVERIIGMLLDDENPVSLDRLIVMTFTKAAANEMKTRIAEAIDEALLDETLSEEMRVHLKSQRIILPRARISTIDSICQGLIKQHFQELDIDPGFRVADETEIKLLKSDILDHMLERHYEAGDGWFLKLAEAFDLKNVILEAFDKAETKAWPERFLNEAMSDLIKESEGRVEETAWFDRLLKEVEGSVRYCMSMMQEARECCTCVGGWPPYIPAVDEVIKFAEGVARIFDEEGTGNREKYEKLYEVAGSFESSRLSTASDKNKSDAEKANRKRAKTLIDEARGILKALPNKAPYDFSSMETGVRRSAEQLKELINLILEFSQIFSERKRDRNIVDFSDLEHMALKLLYKEENGEMVPTEFSEAISREYDEILIDEYQDSNDIQDMLVEGLNRGENKHAFMVGDVKQSIYAFREAKPELFIKRCETEKRIDLNMNFRSRPEVINTVNDIFRDIMKKELGGIDYDEAAELKPGRRGIEPDPEHKLRSELLLLNDDSNLGGRDGRNGTELEALMIARRVSELSKDYELRDIAILVKTATHVSELIDALAEYGIPSYFNSGKGYFESTEVKLMLSYLNVIDNPRNDIDLAAVLRCKAFGDFNDDELSAIRITGRSQNKELDFYDCLKLYAEKNEKAAGFLETLNRYRDLSSRLKAHELIDLIFRETGFYNNVSAMNDGLRRQKNLDKLLEKAENYSAGSYHGLFNFNRYISELKKIDEDLGEASAAAEGENIVGITTIHKSKGLQYKIAIVAFTESPYNKDDLKKRVMIDNDYGFGCNFIDTENRISYKSAKLEMIKLKKNLDICAEQLRVLYVALTRAEDKLIIAGRKNTTDMNDDSLPIDKKVDECNSFLDLILKSRAFSWSQVTTYEPLQVIPEELMTGETEAGEEKAFDSAAFRAGLVENLGKSYAYEADITLKPKASVSELKAAKIAMFDEEFVETLENERAVKEGDGSMGAQFGTLVHRAFELLNYENPGEGLKERLIGECYDEEMVDRALGHIESFRGTELFNVMKDAALKGILRREQHFMVGLPACEMNPGKTDSEELQLLQGIIDAYCDYDDEIYLIDYKTDNVADDEVLIKRYALQLELYAKALEQLTEKKVTKRIIYSTRLKKSIEV
ncbi:MAG: helicase-exonuclease AddAB subunit AddA [Eubacteriales bacterium]|nr:helicase-exonuclease AddAB subunit AddA [Eubacteriales bacterium]